MITENIHLPSSDGITQLNAYVWTPEPGTEIKALLQLCHGMCEHIKRYEAFAEVLTEAGYAVIGHDHLGHGGAVIDDAHHCYFSKENGYENVVEAMHRLTEEGKRRFSGVPNFILGHSMGSFMLRYYLTKYSSEVAGAVVMGTGWIPASLAAAGGFFSRVSVRMRGELYPSPFLAKLMLGNFNKPFAPNRTPVDWLSRDPAVADAYMADPRCGETFTAKANQDFYGVIKKLARGEGLENIRKDLPVLLISGSEDPVGGAAAVPKVRDQYVELGLTDVTMVLMEGDRHEVLNELDKEVTYQTIIDWMNERI